MQTETPIAGMHTAAYPQSNSSHVSGVSWGAVLAGAVAAAALSFILLILGFGLGLSAVSPWSYNTTAIGTSTIVWLAFMQLASAGIGGYLAGRLRTKWVAVHTDEVYFRDTAHGLLAWAVATLLTAGLMAGAVHTVLGAAAETGAGVANAAGRMAQGNGGNAPLAYFGDMLMRTQPATPDTDNGAMRAEVGRIFANDLRAGALAPDDRAYLSAMLAKRTGMAPADADRRVDDVYARLSKATADAEAAAKDAAEKARKAAVHSSLWMFVALLIGAFVASLCATYGGRRRDGL
jgi:hypothetical protein